MSEVKQNLKNVVEITMIPEVEEYLEDLHKLLEEEKATKDDMDAIREMESFLVELQNILLVLEENKISDEEVEKVYQNIMTMIEENKA